MTTVTGPLYMGRTKSGEQTHLVQLTNVRRWHRAKSLCGRRIASLVRPYRRPDAPPIPYTDHWANDSTVGRKSICAHCAAKL